MLFRAQFLIFAKGSKRPWIIEVTSMWQLACQDAGIHKSDHNVAFSDIKVKPFRTASTRLLTSQKVALHDKAK